MPKNPSIWGGLHILSCDYMSEMMEGWVVNRTESASNTCKRLSSLCSLPVKEILDGLPFPFVSLGLGALASKSKVCD